MINTALFFFCGWYNLQSNLPRLSKPMINPSTRTRTQRTLYILRPQTLCRHRSQTQKHSVVLRPRWTIFCISIQGFRPSPFVPEYGYEDDGISGSVRERPISMAHLRKHSKRTFRRPGFFWGDGCCGWCQGRCLSVRWYAWMGKKV